MFMLDFVDWLCTAVIGEGREFLFSLFQLSFDFHFLAIAYVICSI